MRHDGGRYFRCSPRTHVETGDYATIKELADADNINLSYVSRLLPMTMLPPGFVEAILEGCQPHGHTLARAMQPLPMERIKQTNLPD